MKLFDMNNLQNINGRLITHIFILKRLNQL